MKLKAQGLTLSYIDTGIEIKNEHIINNSTTDQYADH